MCASVCAGEDVGVVGCPGMATADGSVWSATASVDGRLHDAVQCSVRSNWTERGCVCPGGRPSSANGAANRKPAYLAAVD